MNANGHSCVVYVDTNWLHAIEVTTDLAECLHTVDSLYQCSAGGLDGTNSAFMVCFNASNVAK